MENLSNEKETTLGLKALAYKNIFFDNNARIYQIKKQTCNEEKVIESITNNNNLVNKCNLNLMLVTALGFGYIFFYNYTKLNN